MERGSRFQSGVYGTGEYYEYVESEVNSYKKITYRESEQLQQELRTHLYPSAESLLRPYSESCMIRVGEAKTK